MYTFPRSSQGGIKRTRSVHGTRGKWETVISVCLLVCLDKSHSVDYLTAEGIQQRGAALYWRWGEGNGHSLKEAFQWKTGIEKKEYTDIRQTGLVKALGLVNVNVSEVSVTGLFWLLHHFGNNRQPGMFSWVQTLIQNQICCPSGLKPESSFFLPQTVKNHMKSYFCKIIKTTYRWYFQIAIK